MAIRSTKMRFFTSCSPLAAVFRFGSRVRQVGQCTSPIITLTTGEQQSDEHWQHQPGDSLHRRSDSFDVANYVTRAPGSDTPGVFTDYYLDVASNILTFVCPMTCLVEKGRGSVRLGWLTAPQLTAGSGNPQARALPPIQQVRATRPPAPQFRSQKP